MADFDLHNKGIRSVVTSKHGQRHTNVGDNIACQGTPIVRHGGVGKDSLRVWLERTLSESIEQDKKHKSRCLSPQGPLDLKYLGKTGRVCKFNFHLTIAREKGRPSSARAANPDLDSRCG